MTRRHSLLDLPHKSERLRYAGLGFGTMALGLLVHSQTFFLPPGLRDVIGDALWATMIVWWVSLLTPNSALRTRSICALAFCVIVELSQLSQAPWLKALRALPGGHLVLGSGFDPRDQLAYAGGVLIAGLDETRWRKWHGDAEVL